MDYTSRTSQQFRGGQSVNSRGAGTGQNRTKQDEPEAFMRLNDAEIAGCISDIGVPFTVQDLHKPQPEQIQKIFELFADLLMNITHETVGPAMVATAEEVCKETGIDVTPETTRNLLGLYTSLKKLLFECGILDLSFTDLYTPTHNRLVKIFSYIINFVRFRETQASTIDSCFNKVEATKSRIDTLYSSNEECEARLQEIARSRAHHDVQARDKSARNEALKAKLLALNQGQAKVAERLERSKNEKTHLTAELTQKTEKAVTLRQEAEKLKPYAQLSSTALQAQLNDLPASIAQNKSQADTLEKRTRALMTRTDLIATVSTEVTSCISSTHTLSQELTQEETDSLSALKRREALSTHTSTVREISRTEELLQRQLQRWLDRTAGLHKSSAEKTEQAKLRMEELRVCYKEVKGNWEREGREVEVKKIKVEQLEKMMEAEREGLEEEVRSAREEFGKLESKVRLYVVEMEQAMAC